MSRPSRNNADYFPHYNSLRNHRKVKALRNKFGAVVGYAFWCLMLEWLSEQENLEWEYSEVEAEMFAAELGVSAAETIQIVAYCIKLGLLKEGNDGILYSEGLKEQLSLLKTPKENRAPRLHSMNFQLWKSMRSFVFERDNYTCSYCGKRGIKLEVDHIKPLSRGGTNDYSNLTAACVRCNRQKANKSLTEFTAWRAKKK